MPSPPTAPCRTEKDRQITVDTFALLEAENGGLMDFDHTAVVGHSAGGRTALDMLAAGGTDVAVGYAAAGGATNNGRPVMLIAARNDIGVTTSSTEELYASLSSPKRLIIIEETGHNSFSDICTPIREGASLAQLAREAGLQIDERLLALAEDGCSEADLAPEDAWSIAQHFTVAELRAVFGIDDPPVGLGPGVADKFVTAVEYRQE
jgi:predicted dienelactone hydrolase